MFCNLFNKTPPLKCLCLMCELPLPYYNQYKFKIQSNLVYLRESLIAFIKFSLFLAFYVLDSSDSSLRLEDYCNGCQMKLIYVYENDYYYYCTQNRCYIDSSLFSIAIDLLILILSYIMNDCYHCFFLRGQGGGPRSK